jgi:Ca-activated chloride channel family protein
MSSHEVECLQSMSLSLRIPHDGTHMSSIRPCRLGLFATLFMLGAWIPTASGSSTASRNKEGNRLFQQGKYQEAEKAYVDAEVQSPGRPELLYNLGNALIKQKKYERALQSLHQAINKGDKGLQESGWFNAGNALFEMGKFKDSAQAYIQALRINPADEDAKHNLEMALRKEDEKKQMGSGQNSKDSSQQTQESKENQRAANKEAGQQDKQKPQQGQPQENQPKPANPQATQAQQRDESLNKERALQILDALKNQELAEQRKLLEQKARRKANARDW